MNGSRTKRRRFSAPALAPGDILYFGTCAGGRIHVPELFPVILLDVTTASNFASSLPPPRGSEPSMPWRAPAKDVVEARPEVKRHKLAPQPNAGGKVELRAEKPQAAQEVPPEAKLKVSILCHLSCCCRLGRVVLLCGCFCVQHWLFGDASLYDNGTLLGCSKLPVSLLLQWPEPENVGGS